MIDKYDATRIADDAMIAADALSSIIECKDHLHPNYIKEKIRVVKNCVEFIESFCEGE